MTCGCKRADQEPTKRLVPIEDKIFLKEGYYTPPAAPSSPEPILVPGPSTLLEVSEEEAEQQVQEVAKFFKQLGGAPAIVAFTNGDWMEYVEECFEEMGRGKGKERMEVTTNKAEKASEKISEMVELSQIRILTSKITQVCQDIHDIKLRRLLITQLDKKPNDITNRILTNQSDCKNTWGSGRSRPDPLDTHEDHAEDGNNYVCRTPNLLEHDIQNNQEDHERCPPQPRPKPSRMTPEPLPSPVPSEASETSSSLLTFLLLLPKKDDIEPVASSMYTERPDLSWNLDLAPTKKTGGVEPVEESEMREGTGLRREGASPCLEFGRGIGTGAAQPDRTDSEAEPPLSAIASTL